MTPISPSAAWRSGGNEVGSSSIAISAPGTTANSARMRPRIAVRQSPGSAVGVPPPQWIANGDAPADQPGDAGDLLLEQRRIGAPRRVEPHHRRVAAAVVAQPVAERHMQIERQRRLGRQRLQPLGVGRRADRRREMRRGRIGRCSAARGRRSGRRVRRRSSPFVAAPRRRDVDGGQAHRRVIADWPDAAGRRATGSRATAP